MAKYENKQWGYKNIISLLIICENTRIHSMYDYFPVCSLKSHTLTGQSHTTYITPTAPEMMGFKLLFLRIYLCARICIMLYEEFEKETIILNT